MIHSEQTKILGYLTITDLIKNNFFPHTQRFGTPVEGQQSGVCSRNHTHRKVILMDERNFLLNIIKYSPLLIKTALLTLAADSSETRVANLSPELISTVELTLTSVLEPIRQHQYFQVRDRLVQVRPELILPKPYLKLSSDGQELFTYVLSYLAVLGDELYYRGGSTDNQSNNILPS